MNWHKLKGSVLHSGTHLTLTLLIVFNVVFPKGGIKLSGIPITWGYLLLALVTIVFLLYGFFVSNFSSTKNRWNILLMNLPFQVYCLLSFASLGFTDIGWLASFLLNLILFPYVFLVLLAKPIENLDVNFFATLLKNSVFFVAIYGIVLFVYKIITNEWFEIPYLTINAGDVDQIDLKHIDRGGGIFKLISTFNNGNIYGICILLLLPLFEVFENRAFRKSIVKFSLLLTLSRTVWIGLLLYEFLFKLYINRITLNSLFKIVVVTFVSVLSVFVVSISLSTGKEFLFDPNLGGRLNQFFIVSNFQFFSNKPFEGIAEIVYLSILNEFGLIGLILYIIAMSSPIIFGFYAEDKTKRAIISGLSIYLIISFSDGALLFIPVLLYFWFLVSFAQRRHFVLNYKPDQFTGSP